jgi:two-component system nitrogen regulation sensor histidine kinase GlnL
MAGAAELVSGLAVPALLVAPDGRITMANLAAESLLNSSEAALRERGWEAAFAQDMRVPDLLRRARDEGGSCAAYDVELQLALGRSVRADVLITPVVEAPGWLSVAFQHRAVTGLVDRHLQQKGAARSAAGVAQALAHEIKNPLSGIRGAAQLLATPHVPDAERDELTRLIIAEVDRITKLVDRLESFSDTRPMKLRPVNIHELLGHVRRVAVQGFAQGLGIRERYDPSLPPVAGNRDALVQVFLNLLKNASEALDKNGFIGIATAYRPGLKVRPADGGAAVSLPLEVQITDNGPGLPPELADHVFEPFVTSKPGGSGLGLALVAKIVADHGGLVEYERDHGRGESIFRVLLPVAQAGDEDS